MPAIQTHTVVLETMPLSVDSVQRVLTDPKSVPTTATTVTGSFSLVDGHETGLSVDVDGHSQDSLSAIPLVLPVSVVASSGNFSSSVEEEANYLSVSDAGNELWMI